VAPVFISWGSPDVTAAEELAARLKSAGIDAFFSRTDMPAESARREVNRQIDEARVAILALSNESVAREWVRDEIALCVAARDRPQSPMRVLIPVVAGPLSADRVPQALGDLNRFDLVTAAGRELSMTRVVTEVLRGLGEDAPIVIPGALFALDEQLFQELWEPGNAKVDQRLERLHDLWCSVGMNGDANWRDRIRELLSSRYRPAAADFSPFRERPPLRVIVDEVVRAINGKRRPIHERPLWIRWDTVLLMDAMHRRDLQFVAERRAASCLTIVDAVSACHDSIYEAIAAMPSPSNASRSAVVWIPPFFRDATDVELRIQQLVNDSAPLQEAYLDWGAAEGRSVAFHTATPQGLGQWLRQALAVLAKPPGAVETNRHDMDAGFPTAMDPRAFHRKRD
jgi:hypothetical protein